MSVILEKRSDGIARVTIDRPEALSALDVPAKERLGAIWQEIAADPGVRVVILTGAGARAFCAGSDIKEIARTGRMADAIGKLPIATQFVFTGVIVPGPAGDSIEATIPLIPVLPNTPDGAIVELSATLGTRAQSYYRTVRGRRVRFMPKGATLPGGCPVGGWPFAATFGFGDGSSASAVSSVACAGSPGS